MLSIWPENATPYFCRSAAIAGSTRVVVNCFGAASSGSFSVPSMNRYGDVDRRDLPWASSVSNSL